MAASSILYLGDLSCAASAATIAEAYGDKTAGVEDPLLSLQKSSPVTYYVPEGIALPPLDCGEITASHLDRAFEEISRLSNEPRPWLARSSALNEQSGCHDSPVFYVDPQDRQGSFRTFKKTVETMRDSDPKLGVLLMPMVGEWSELAGSRVLGAEIVSFAADTVNPFRPSEMHLAFVQGLGIGAVGTGNDAVLVAVDRESGKITFFGNLDEQRMREQGGSNAHAICPSWYRQKNQYFFNPKTKQIESQKLDPKYFKSDPDSLLIDDGVLRHTEFPDRHYDELLGVTPFDNLEMLSNLISIMRYVHAERGPSQIEGAFLSRHAPFPYLYQHTKLAPAPEQQRDIAPFKRHIYSDSVIGYSSFEGPLVWYLGERGKLELRKSAYRLKDIDAAFAESGYILLGNQPRDVMNFTRNCRHRIAQDYLNASGHAITLMRYSMNERPEDGFTIAENAQVMNSYWSPYSIGGIRGQIKYDGDIVVFDKARLDSNGRELVVEIIGKRSLWDRLFPW